MNNSKHRAANGGLDQYFTPGLIATELTHMAKTFAAPKSVWIEPSAGDCVFEKSARMIGIKEVKCFDLAPRHAHITKQDWLAYEHTVTKQPVVVFGNPPFGFAASMAVKFFNKAAEFADTIAFVLPGSFAKDSVQRRLDPRFELVWQDKRTIEFEFPEGGTKAVPCVMQVWKLMPKGTIRETPEKDFGKDLPLTFIKPAPKRCIVAIRRVGGRAGQIIDTKDGSENTTYFIECDAKMLAVIRRADLTKYVNDTAGVRSLSKQELIKAIREAM